MRSPSLTKRLFLAATLAALYPAAALFVAPVGPGLWLPVAAAAWIAALAPSARRKLGGCFLALGLSLGGFALLGDPLGGVAGAALALAYARRAGERATARALVIEGSIAALALVCFRWLDGPDLVSSVVALWGFFLVQIGGTLLGDTPPCAPCPDAFSEAGDRLEALLREE